MPLWSNEAAMRAQKACAVGTVLLHLVNSSNHAFSADGRRFAGRSPVAPIPGATVQVGEEQVFHRWLQRWRRTTAPRLPSRPAQCTSRVSRQIVDVECRPGSSRTRSPLSKAQHRCDLAGRPLALGGKGQVVDGLPAAAPPAGKRTWASRDRRWSSGCSALPRTAHARLPEQALGRCRAALLGLTLVELNSSRLHRPP